MLSAMYSVLARVIILSSLISVSAARSQSTIPDLQVLPPGDAIGLWRSQVSSEELRFLRALTRPLIAACDANPNGTERRTAAELFNRIRIEHIALTASGSSGLVVQGAGPCMCDTFGKCPFWIIDNQHHPMVVLKAHSIQAFEVRKSLAAGHCDLVLSSRTSEIATSLENFRFDGRRYRRKGCTSLVWADKYGTLLVPPRIAPVHCD